MNSKIAAHVYWTRPRAEDVPLDTLERSVLAASAVVWRSINGPILLFTDRLGRKEFEDAGLLPLWDHVDTETLESIPPDIHAKAFWDFGKTMVLAKIPPGAIVLDLDLIVWKPLPPVQCAVSFLHWEAPVSPWYPGPADLSVGPGYFFDGDFDWEAPVCNTALLCSPDQRVSKAFLAAALRYARNNRSVGTGIAEMLFAGQRLLAHVARRLDVRLNPIIDYLYVPCGKSMWLTESFTVEDPLAPDACDNGVPFTHLWRYKHILREHPDEAAEFRTRLLRRCRDRVGEAVMPWESDIGYSKRM
jgi:hypothetical protein